MNKIFRYVCFLLLFLLLFTGCSKKKEEPVRLDLEEVKKESVEEESVEIISEESSFQIHYIDVGQADATLIMCDGKSMLIDGGNTNDSSLIYTYLKDHNVSFLDYMICTHAHEDHVGGLAGALNYADVGVVYSPVKNDDSEAFRDFIKYVQKRGKEIQVPEVGTEFSVGSAKCRILGLNVSNDDPNNTSIVMKITYGETSFLFSGDAEASVESVILDRGEDISCTVIKIPHHGSDTSLSYRWLREAMPEYGVISVGENNAYGHPTKDTLSKLSDAEVKVLRTDLQGDIICTSDGKTVAFDTEKNNSGNVSNEKENEEGKEQSYILNTNTKKFHYPGCRSVADMKEKNKEEVILPRDDVMEQGYEPCGNCHP